METTSDSQSKHQLELAAAALMFEISRSDNTIQDEERKVIKKLVKSEFNISEQEAEILMDKAETKIENAVSLFEFTRKLNDHLTISERIKIIENLWQVAYADGQIDKYEEHYLRKISDLLYVSHKDYIRVKLKAENAVT